MVVCQFQCEIEIKDVDFIILIFSMLSMTRIACQGEVINLILSKRINFTNDIANS